jgi:hypothetical protein
MAEDNMNLEKARSMIMIAIVFGLFDYDLGQFLLKACEEVEE